MRPLLLAMLVLGVAAPAASAQVAVDVKVTPSETRYGSKTTISGTVTENGAPVAGRRVHLQGRRYPFRGDFRWLATGTTAADGTVGFEREFDRNFDVRLLVGDVASAPVRAFVFPRIKLTFKPRNSRVIALTQRYRVPHGVKLERPTRFYVGRRGRPTAPLAATADVKQVASGRFVSKAVVRIPSAWGGRFRYASCFTYTPGSGMGDPKAKCPKRFKF
jgi:hypothetical protein